MNKKRILIIIAIILIITSLIVIYFISNNKKLFYLDSRYYNSKGLTDESVKELEKKIKNKESFVLFVYNDFCSFSVPCDSVFEEASNDLNIQILQIPYRDYKTSSIKKIKYAPSIIVYKKGKIVKFLDAEDNEDKERYQDVKKFKVWLSKIIYLEKEKK